MQTRNAAGQFLFFFFFCDGDPKVQKINTLRAIEQYILVIYYLNDKKRKNIEL